MVRRTVPSFPDEYDGRDEKNRIAILELLADTRSDRAMSAFTISQRLLGSRRTCDGFDGRSARECSTA
jgi:hypothetical protein